MSSIKVINPGFSSSLQDLGRRGTQSYGVPVSGPMDSISFKLANAILDNFINDAVMECTMSGPSLLFNEETEVCITGADAEIRVNDRLESSYKRITVKKGDILKVGNFKKGIRCYIAVRFGFITKEYMNSKSYYYPLTPQGFLSANDILEFTPFKTKTPKTGTRVRSPQLWSRDILRVQKGPEWHFVQEQAPRLLEQALLIGPNNRMGYRIDSDLQQSWPEMFSSAVLPGTVQATPSGQLLVATADCQVSGGYPRILMLDQEALSILSQKKTGEHISFDLLPD